MDPKANSQLDPKLQQAYDKVMGISLQSPTPTPQDMPSTLPEPAQATQTPLDTAQSSTSPSVPPIASMPSDNVVPVSPSLPIIQPTPAQQVVTSAPTEIGQQENKTNTKPHAFVADNSRGLKVSPVILAIGAIAFLLIYTIVWVKVFNVPVPFINQ